MNDACTSVENMTKEYSNGKGTKQKEQVQYNLAVHY